MHKISAQYTKNLSLLCLLCCLLACGSEDQAQTQLVSEPVETSTPREAPPAKIPLRYGLDLLMED
ncbi:MAG: hypothetical protein AAFV07_05075, partial [Bacteroidota bacterium]